MARLWLVVTLTAVLTACGFHLRGSGPNADNLPVTYLDLPAGAAIAEPLRRGLRQADAGPAASVDDAQALLRVMDENNGRRVLSVGSRGKVAEYQLSYTVRFALAVPPANAPVEDSLTINRDFVFDETAVLAKDEEVQALREEMRREAAQSLLSRLAAAAQATVPPTELPEE